MTASAATQTLDALADHALAFASQQLEATVTAVGDTTRFPRSTLEDGSWKLKDADSWTTGFFPGCLWAMYGWTSDEKWKTWASGWTASAENQKTDTGTHDVGFKIFCSFGKGYRLTQAGRYRDVIVCAAQSLASRYNAIVGCTRSWDNRTFPVIIDNMMNLELLLWASKHGGQSEWYDMAVSHALRTMDDHVREDGSTIQIVDYNPNTGEIIRKETHQGYDAESTWSRGQAWGVYGFTMMFRETGDARFLMTAKSLADYIVAHLPEDFVPYWDYDAPNIPDEEKDASAAAITASALLELSTLADQPEDRAYYGDAAFRILESLCSDAYLAEGTVSGGILLHGVGNHNRNTEVDVSLIYADYYFLEALLRYKALTAPSMASNEDAGRILESVRLESSYPNPFNSATQISYSLAAPMQVSLCVYDLSGRLMRTIVHGFQDSGEFRVPFFGDDLPSGTYFAVLNTDRGIRVRRMTLLR